MERNNLSLTFRFQPFLVMGESESEEEKEDGDNKDERMIHGKGK